MKLLFDTHALLWWVLGDERLGKKARDAVADPDNEVFISSASIWEISIKFRAGKLPEAEGFVARLRAGTALPGVDELPMTSIHALRAGLLDAAHKDPFDRMLIAQAQLDGHTLLSSERLFDAFGVTRLWG